MDQLIAAYKANANRYPVHYIYLTFDTDFALSTVLKPCDYTEIILPTKNRLYYQRLTTIKICNKKQFYKYINLFKNCRVHILGFKLEGILLNQEVKNIRDFLYFEKHEKNENIDYFKNKNSLLNYSVKHCQIVSSERIYDRNYIPEENKIKVCYFEYWKENIEKEWLDCAKDHYDLLKLYCIA